MSIPETIVSLVLDSIPAAIAEAAVETDKVVALVALREITTLLSEYWQTHPEDDGIRQRIHQSQQIISHIRKAREARS